MQTPYPPSDILRGVRWLTEPLLYPESHGDVWTCTWADDGNVYAVSDDTFGIDKACNSNLAVHLITGTPPDHTAATVNPMAEYGHLGQREGRDTWKADGLASVDGVLYMGVSQHSGAGDYPDNIQRVYDGSIVKSTDHGKTWSAKPRAGAGEAMFPGPRFATPFFVQYGQDYQGALDEYVYAVSNGDTWNNGNYMMLGRVRRDLIGRLDHADWEFYAGLDEQNRPVWTGDILAAHRGSRGIFKHRGFTSMTGMQYVPAMERFVLAQWAYTDLDGPHPWDRTALFLYEAPRPWGPWRHFHTEPDWGVSWYNPGLPSKWFEAGGLTMWMTMAGNFQRTPGRPFAYGLTVQKLELLCRAKGA